MIQSDLSGTPFNCEARTIKRIGTEGGIAAKKRFKKFNFEYFSKKVLQFQIVLYLAALF